MIPVFLSERLGPHKGRQLTGFLEQRRSPVFLEGHTYTVVSCISNHNDLQQKDHPQRVLNVLASLVHRDVANMSFEYNLIWSERPLHCKPSSRVMESE